MVINFQPASMGSVLSKYFQLLFNRKKTKRGLTRLQLLSSKANARCLVVDDPSLTTGRSYSGHGRSYRCETLQLRCWHTAPRDKKYDSHASSSMFPIVQLYHRVYRGGLIFKSFLVM